MADALRTELDLTLTKEEAEGLASFIDTELESDDDAVRLLIGDGHSGYGLYASCPDYPEEGAIIIKALPDPSGVLVDAPALPQRELDALLDHIYEHGTTAEGIRPLALALCQAYASGVRAVDGGQRE